jgi:hypothetical protein
MIAGLGRVAKCGAQVEGVAGGFIGFRRPAGNQPVIAFLVFPPLRIVMSDLIAGKKRKVTSPCKMLQFRFCTA